MSDIYDKSIIFILIISLGMQYFKTKGELLEYMGKNKADVRLVDRMMAKGDIRKDEEWYFLVKEAINERLGMVKELEWEVERLKEENESLRSAILENGGSWKDENKEDAVNVEYYKGLYEKEIEEGRERLKKCHKWLVSKWMRIRWEDFEEFIYSDEE